MRIRTCYIDMAHTSKPLIKQAHPRTKRSVLRVERDFHDRVVVAAAKAGQTLMIYVQRNLALPDD